jgi:NSS family neurotransmitter:Na+ symporter
MPGMNIGKWWEVMIKFIAPLILTILLITELVAGIKLPYKGFPRGAELIGAAVMFVIIPVAAIIFSRLKGVGPVDSELSKKAK